MILRVLSLSFIQRTVTLLGGLTVVLSSCDMLGKSTPLHGFSLLIALAGLVPSMMVFAFPLAVYLASGSLALELVQSNEILMLWYLPDLRRAWYQRLAFLVLCCGVAYGALTLTVSQQAFHAMRRLLVASIEQHIHAVDPGMLHHISKNLSIYADDVGREKNNLNFKGLFLGFKMGAQHGVALAPRADFIDHQFHLHEATVILYDRTKPPSQGSACEITLDLEHFFDGERTTADEQLKRLSLYRLAECSLQGPGVWQEWVRRVGLVVWFFAMPWLGWLHGIAFGRRRKNLLFLILSAGTLLLVLYILSHGVAASSWPISLFGLPLISIIVATYFA